MDKTCLHDKELSWKAKGIMAYMLSMPDDWTFFMSELQEHSTDGEKSFRAGFKELTDAGYVKRFPIREGNKIISWETVVHEVPLLAGFVQVQKVDVQNVHVQNDVLLSTNSTKNNNTKNNSTKRTSVDSSVINEIVDYLNEKASTEYRSSTKKTIDLINARMNETFTIDDFKTVIDKKTVDWLNDEKMGKFLRPETLFGTKFESYLNEKWSGANGINQRPNQQSNDASGIEW